MSTHANTTAFTDFESAFKKEFEGRRCVSESMYMFLRLLVALFTFCAVAMAASYAVQLGESWWFKVVIIATAVALELAVVFVSAVIYPQWVVLGNQVLAGVLLPLLSGFTVLSFMVSQQFAQDHRVEEMAKRYVSNLQEDALKLSATERDERGALAATRNRIEGMLTELKGSKGSKATAIYHYIADLSGASVEAIVLAVRGLSLFHHSGEDKIK